MKETSIQDLAAAVLAGDRRSIARAITVVENEDDRAAALIEELHGKGGQAFVIGITGPPGAGKSTLVAALVEELRKSERSVGVIAVDPTSPFSGGALLGDRIRMNKVATDPAVFIRSMATRGSLGGLSRKTGDAVIVLDAAGFDIIVIETVGVGQSEVEIASTADTTAVVLSPESGDGIQAMKAGLMEIADVFCINKADREGADRLVREITQAMHMKAASPGAWSPPVLTSVARSGKGVPELIAAIEQHKSHHEQAGTLAATRRRNSRRRVLSIASDELARRLRALDPELLDSLAGAVVARTKTPYRAASELIAAFFEQQT